MPDNCPINVSPYDLPNVIKTPNIINLNYTNQDFWSMKARLTTFIEQRFGPEGSEIPNTFNDFVESSIAMMLIENWAFIADTLSFKIDQIVNELFIDTVTETENAFRLAKLVGFKAQPPLGAISNWTATANSARSSDIIIPTPYPIDLAIDGSGITIELFQANSNGEPLFGSPIIIPPGETVNSSIVGIEGKTVTDTFIGTGEPSQIYVTGNNPVLYDSVSVVVDGRPWQKVDYFTDSQPRLEYLFDYDSLYRGYIIFGNGRSGLIPSANSSISVTYRYGGGQRGNIITNYANVSILALVDGVSYQVPVVISNYTRGRWGYDGDTIDDIRRKLPQWVRAQNRAVSGADYKTLTDQFATAYHGIIGKSNAVLRNHGCAGNIIDIYVLARNGDMNLEPASNGLKVALNEELTKKKMLTDFVCIRDGSVILVDTLIEVTVDKFYRKFEDEIRQSILDKAYNFFSLNNWDYGQNLRSIDLVRQLSDLKQIDSFHISFTTIDSENSGDIVNAKYYEIIRPDQTNVTFMYV